MEIVPWLSGHRIRARRVVEDQGQPCVFPPPFNVKGLEANQELLGSIINNDDDTMRKGVVRET
jgi:hypothetical protein